jgi:hypothetical protein
MRLVDGQTLAERMQAQTLLPEETLAMLTPVAGALAAAHAAGVVHRDVKPHNVLITEHNQPYLADFGVAKRSSSTAGLTATGGFVGSITYASPEQIRGEPSSPASDIYALTAVLYQCLSGHVPYPLDTDAGVMHAHLYDPPPKLAPMPRAAALDAVIARGMAKEPADRYRSPVDLMSAAAAALAFDAETPSISVVGNRRGSPSIVPLEDPVVPPPIAFPEGAEIVPPEERAARLDLTTADRRRPAPPGDVAPARRRSHKPLVVAAALLGLVVAAAVTAAVVTSGPARRAASRVFIAHSGPLTIRYSAPWRSATMRSAEASTMSAPVVLLSGTVVLAAGPLKASAAIPAGTPPGLRSALGEPTSVAGAALAGSPAERYDWSARGGKRVTALVLGSGGSDLAAVCTASASASIAGCLRLAGRVTVTGVQILPPGPDASLTAVLHRLAMELEADRRKAAGLRARQLRLRAQPATALAVGERTVARALAQLSPPTRNAAAVTALASAVAAQSSSFTALAHAASANHRTQYARLTAVLRGEDRELRRALGPLHAEGIPVALADISLPRLPPAPAQQPTAPVTGSPGPAPSAYSPSLSAPSSPPASTPSPAASTQSAHPAYTPPPQGSGTSGNGASHAPPVTHTVGVNHL